jgi:hypothetical protein
VVRHRYPPRVNNRPQRLLQEIETGALDQKTPIADLLRKVIILGGQAGSEEMSDWASRELDGYGPDDELPPYRRLKTAALYVDTINMRASYKGQIISWMQLPAVVRQRIANEVILRWRIVEIEQMARQSPPDEPFRLSPPSARWAVAIMNSDAKQSAHVTDLYRAVSPVLLVGVVDQVRTTLTKMMGELRATMQDDTAVLPLPLRRTPCSSLCRAGETRSASQLLRARARCRLQWKKAWRSG